jgi:hypothetical protein
MALHRGYRRGDIAACCYLGSLGSLGRYIYGYGGAEAGFLSLGTELYAQSQLAGSAGSDHARWVQGVNCLLRLRRLPPVCNQPCAICTHGLCLFVPTAPAHVCLYNNAYAKHPKPESWGLHVHDTQGDMVPDYWSPGGADWRNAEETGCSRVMNDADEWMCRTGSCNGRGRQS